MKMKKLLVNKGLQFLVESHWGRVTVLYILTVVFCILILLAVVPRILNYQGKLLDSEGIGVNDTLDMTFRLYTDESGGTAIWSETIPDVVISKGLFSVELSGFPDTVDFSEQYWLEIEVAGEVMSPREHLTSAPYAFRTAIADSLSSYTGCGELLIVKSSNVYDRMSPQPGSWFFPKGSTVEAEASASAIVDNVFYKCIGWVGSGSVPASGDTTFVSFVIDTTSTITWQWRQGPHPEITPDPATVCAGVDLALQGNPSGGSGIYISHQWTGDGATYLDNTEIENPTFNCNIAGTYELTYTVTDDEGVTGSDDVRVIVYPLPVATASNDGPVLIGSDLHLSGGPDGMVSYSWTGPDGFSSSEQNPTITNVTLSNAGDYTLAVTDSNGCINSAITNAGVIKIITDTYTDGSMIASADNLVVSGGQVKLELSPWLTGWSYRKGITINGSSAGAQTDYQMGVIRVHKGSGTDTASGDNGSVQNVYVGSNVRDDFGDVRFAASDGTTLLDYWMEDYVSGDYADFWVKVNSIPTGSSTIYVYYGNAGASSASNGGNTFELYNVTGIVAFWHMDEPSWSGTSADVMDETGINNGTAKNGVTTTADGKFKRAGDFDGADDYVSTPLTPNFNEATIVAWIRASGTPSEHSGIVSNYNTGDGNHLGLSLIHI